MKYILALYRLLNNVKVIFGFNFVSHHVYNVSISSHYES